MTKHNRFSFPKKVLVAVAIIAVLFFAFAMSVGKNTPTTLRIETGLSNCSPSYLPLLVALDRGLFEKAGLVPLIHADYNRQISPDNFDVVIAGRARVYLSEATSPGKLSVFATNYLDKSRTNYAVLVRKNSTFDSLPSLGSKQIGVEFASGTARFVLMRIILEHNGLDTSNTKVIDATIGDLRDGRVDALYLREPELSLALSEGNFRILVDEPVANYVMSPWPMSFYALSNDFALKNPAAAEKAISALDAAIVIIRNDPEYAAGVLQECMQVYYGKPLTPRPLLQWQQNADLAVIQRQMDLYWQNSLIPSQINATTLIRH